MFAFRSRTEIAYRVLLIAVILFNAFASSAVPVQAEPESVSGREGQLESRSIPTFPTFERPAERITGRDEHQTDESARMSNSTYLQSGQLQMYTADGEEGLRLEQNSIGGGNPNLAADWIV